MISILNNEKIKGIIKHYTEDAEDLTKKYGKVKIDINDFFYEAIEREFMQRSILNTIKKGLNLEDEIDSDKTLFLFGETEYFATIVDSLIGETLRQLVNKDFCEVHKIDELSDDAYELIYYEYDEDGIERDYRYVGMGLHLLLEEEYLDKKYLDKLCKKYKEVIS